MRCLCKGSLIASKQTKNYITFSTLHFIFFKTLKKLWLFLCASFCSCCFPNAFHAFGLIFFTLLQNQTKQRENAILFIYVSWLIEHRQDRTHCWDEQGNNCHEIHFHKHQHCFCHSHFFLFRPFVNVWMRNDKFSSHLWVCCMCQSVWW